MNYRKEVDGLRAIAVTAVILFHAGFENFKGGFLGVDIFFVISGYLITSIIINSTERNLFSFSDFYIRRARRILPALITLLAICIIPALLLFIPSQMRLFATAQACAAIFIANLFYMDQSGYFSPNALEDPLMHLWTLSIEEQFYFLVPAIIFFSWKYTRSRFAITFVLLTLMISSLLYGYFQSRQLTDAIFFNSFARAWELLCGSLISIFRIYFGSASRSSVGIKNIVTFFSFIIVLGCLLTSSEHDAYPGLAYYTVVFSTAILLYVVDEQTLVGRILTLRPLVHVGLISYSAYLWHQPILAFARVGWDMQQNEVFRYFILAPIFVTSQLSWKFIENPIRYGLNSKFFKFKIITAIFLIFCFGLFGNLTLGFENYRRTILPEEVSKTFGEIQIDMECQISFLEAPPETKFCTFGNKNRKSSIAIYGDSHSFPLRKVFDQIGREKNTSVVHTGLGGCPPLFGVYVLNGNYPSAICKQLVEKQIEFAKEHGIKDVFLAARWSLYTDGSYQKGSKIYLLSTNDNESGSQSTSREAFQVGIKKTLDEYGKLGIRVHFLTQVPMQKYDPKQIYGRWYSTDIDDFSNTLTRLSVKYSAHQKHQEFVRNTFKSNIEELGGSVLDLDKVFCNESLCIVGTPTESFYFDNDHLSSYGGMKIRRIIDDAFDGR